jgi:hypothetical protein
MKKSKITFLIFAVIFLSIIMFIIYDFSRKTTFPGNKIENKESDISDPDH